MGHHRQGERRRRGPVPLHLHLANMLVCGAAEGTQTVRAALAGLDAYRRHPYARPQSDAAVLAREGSARLLDYGGGGRGILFVPSLVNHAYILDLADGRSLMRFLAASGLRPLLIDWGTPGEAERSFGLADYIARIERFAAAALAETGDRLSLVGYCMGGTLSAAATRRSDLFDRVAFLAAPWDFHAGGRSHSALAAAALPLTPIIEHMGEAPVELIQSFFAALSPEAVLRKFARFLRLDPDSEEARLFVALEDWANDGPPLAGPTALEVLRDWYALNLPGRGLWTMDGEPVLPAALTLPSLAAVPHADRIVPPSSALGIAGGLADCALVRPSSGHVGMIVGSRARDELWIPLRDWLLTPV